jgi:hypothetical protein
VPDLFGWFEDLSLPQTTLVVSAISAAFAVLWARIRSRGVKWAMAVVSPFVIAWCIYWTPVLLGPAPSDYAAWSIIFLTVWGVPGAIASTLVVYALGKATGRSARGGA